MANRIAIDYGPPGVSGVSTIMGIGALPELPDALREPMPLEEALTKATYASAACWAFGLVTNRPQLKGMGLGGLAVALGIKHLTKR